jgi:hypothetical protein
LKNASRAKTLEIGQIVEPIFSEQVGVDILSILTFLISLFPTTHFGESHAKIFVVLGGPKPSSP